MLAAMIGGKLLVKQVAARIPGVDKLGNFQGTVMSVGMLFLGGFATKKVKALGKYQDQIMLGLGLNLLTEVIGAFAPASVKAMIGMGDLYSAMGEYVTTGEFLTTGEYAPIDDDIALSDYITTGAIESELGIESDLGMVDAHTVGGGVSANAMLKPVRHQSFIKNVPGRSFTKEVPSWNDDTNSPDAIYTGIFRGGY